MEITGEKAEKMLLEEGFLPKAEEGAEGYVSGLTVGERSPFLRRVVLDEKRGGASEGEAEGSAEFGKGVFSGSGFQESEFQENRFLKGNCFQKGNIVSDERLFAEESPAERALTEEDESLDPGTESWLGGEVAPLEVGISETEGEKGGLRMEREIQEKLSETEFSEEWLPFEAGLYRADDADELLYQAGAGSDEGAARVLERIERGEEFSEDFLPFGGMGGGRTGAEQKAYRTVRPAGKEAAGNSFDTPEERILEKLEKRLSQEVACSAEGIYL